MPSFAAKISSLLAQCRWALWLFLALLVATMGFFWLLGHDLHLTRVIEPKAKAPTRTVK